jgi:Tol biopolymer transport system component
MTYPASHFSVTSEGLLAYISVLGGAMKNALVWVDREGNVDPLPNTIAAGNYHVPQLSPDGSQLAVGALNQGSLALFRYDLIRGSMTRITFSEHNECPVWDPNGLRITYMSARDGRPPDIFWVTRDGTDQDGAPLFASSLNFAEFPSSWSSDGRYLLFTDERTKTQLDISFLDRENGFQAQPFLKQSFNEKAAVFHPSGNWIAYAADEEEPGRYEVYAMRFPDGGGKVPISINGGDEPIWDPSGRALYFQEGDKMMVVSIEEVGSKLKVSTPEELFTGYYDSHRTVANYDIDPNGQRFIMIKPVDELVPAQINVVLNWSEELKHLVPTDEE